MYYVANLRNTNLIKIDELSTQISLKLGNQISLPKAINVKVAVGTKFYLQILGHVWQNMWVFIPRKLQEKH